MTADFIMTIPDIPVMFVAGERGRPIPEQAPRAFTTLEAALPSLRGRRFYGVVLGDEYRACVALRPEDAGNRLPHRQWILPGGRYARQKILDYQERLDQIGPAFEQLRLRVPVDTSRPFIEYYRSRRELLVMVPVM